MSKIIRQLLVLAEELRRIQSKKIEEVADIIVKTAKYLDPKERFWAKVNKIPGGCWEWTGAQSHGYGLVRINGKNYSTHRLSLEWATGKKPDGLVACHSCSNAICCNDKHLYWGTVEQNNQDRIKMNRSKGELNGRSRLTKADIKKIKKMREKGLTEIEIAKTFGVGRSTIANILHGRTWSWL